MRLNRNKLRVRWRRDPSEPGRTIVLIPTDEESCRTWASRHGFRFDQLDWKYPAISDACRWLWARASRGLVSDDELSRKVARLHQRIAEADNEAGS
jgi:hypothetical protein